MTRYSPSQSMRGADTFTERAFTLHRLEDFVPGNHLLRPIRQMVNEALVKMDDLFAGMYEADAKGGRPSIAPEKLLRAMLLPKCSTASVRNASSWSRCSTTCCIAGLSAWPWSHANSFFASGQHILDAFPLIIYECVSSGHDYQNRLSIVIFKRFGITFN